MANVNIPDLAALTAPAATDEIEVYDASAAANVRLALSYVALLGTANVFTADQRVNAGLGISLAPSAFLDVSSGSGYDTGTTLQRWSHAEPTNYFGFVKLESPAGDPILSFGTYDHGVTYANTLNMVNGHVLIGTTTDSAQLTVNGAMALVDGMTAPGTTSGWAKIYVDSADGDLKVKFGDGTVKTLATDT